MKFTLFKKSILTVTLLGALQVGAQTVNSSEMLTWVVPTTPTNKPQTEEQTKNGQLYGRELPEPEVLQPRLDSRLSSYTPRKDIELSGTFKGGSSDVMVVLANEWIKKFKVYYPNVNLSITPPFAGSLGSVELVNNKLDFVFVSRELRPIDIEQFKTKFGYDPLSVPISGGSYRHFGALDAVVFFVNKDNPIEKLTFKQIDAMYSKTRHRGEKDITTWGQLGLKGDWADKPIHLVGVKPWNGFEEFVRQRILSVGAKRGEWKDDIKFEKVVFPLAKHVADDKFSISYSGLAYVDKPVKIIPVLTEEGDAPQAPTYENVAKATYPLSRLTYFNVNKDPNKPLPAVLDEFLKFVLSKEGQQIVLDHARYIPLRSEQVESSIRLLK